MYASTFVPLSLADTGAYTTDRMMGLDWKL